MTTTAPTPATTPSASTTDSGATTAANTATAPAQATTPIFHPAPPFDPELAAVLAVVGAQLPSTLTPEMIGPMRLGNITPPIDEVLAARAVKIVVEDRTIPGPEGAPDLTVSIFKRGDHVAGGPGIFHTTAAA